MRKGSLVGRKMALSLYSFQAAFKFSHQGAMQLTWSFCVLIAKMSIQDKCVWSVCLPTGLYTFHVEGLYSSFHFLICKMEIIWSLSRMFCKSKMVRHIKTPGMDLRHSLAHVLNRITIIIWDFCHSCSSIISFLLSSVPRICSCSAHTHHPQVN